MKEMVIISLDRFRQWIDIKIERMTDRADRVYMDGNCTTEEYDAWNRSVNDWAEHSFEVARSIRN